jgi:predicted dehydrogenase
VRVLIIGLGGIGQRHIRNLRASLGDKVEILAYRVRGQSPVLTDGLEVDVGADLAVKYAIREFSELESALAEQPVAAFICNPSSLHLPVALAAAEAGCHLLIEKPLSDRTEGIDALIEKVERKGLCALVAYQLRFHPALRLVHDRLNRGTVGPIVALNAQIGEYLPGWHRYEDYRNMYASRRDLGGGVILSQIHEFDYLYWFLGLPSRVFALGGKRSSLDIDVEDTVSTLMDFQGTPVHLHQDYVQRPPVRSLQIIGDAGKIVADLIAPQVQVFGADGALIESHRFEGFVRNSMYKDELLHFLECVAGRADPVVPLRAGAASLQMALAAKKSLETGRVVVLK